MSKAVGSDKRDPRYRFTRQTIRCTAARTRFALVAGHSLISNGERNAQSRGWQLAMRDSICDYFNRQAFSAADSIDDVVRVL